MPAKRKLDESTSKAGPASPRTQGPDKKVHPFFSQKSNSEPVTGRFLPSPPSLLHYQHLDPLVSGTKPVQVVFYDLDGTLIKTSSGAQFPKNRSDWAWWHPSVPSRIRTEVDQGKHIVILSNQGDGRPKVQEEWKAKLPLIAAKLPDVPFRVLAALSRTDAFRKPNTGMLDHLVHFYTSLGWTIDLEQSVFVGDAAGRAGGAGRRRDHSDTDFKMALNAGLKFLTPEEHFLGQERPSFPDPPLGFKPSTSMKTLDHVSPVFPSNTPIASSQKEIVVFTGPPASGKSTFYKKHFSPRYEHINQDRLGSRDKCLREAAKLLNEGKAVVIDNTNRDKATRAYWIHLANQCDVPIRLFHFQCSIELAKHNNRYRALHDTAAGRLLLPDLAFGSYTSSYEEPKAEEGFDEIRKVNFVWQGDSGLREAWDRYLA